MLNSPSWCFLTVISVSDLSAITPRNEKSSSFFCLLEYPNWWSNTGLSYSCVSSCARTVNRTSGWAGKRLQDVVLTWWLRVKLSPFPFPTPRFPLASGEDARWFDVWLPYESLLVSISRDDVAVSKARGCQERFEVGAEWRDTLGTPTQENRVYFLLETRRLPIIYLSVWQCGCLQFSW